MRKRKKTKTLILGDSFSSNIYVTQDLSDSLLLSWTGSSSTLDGWDFTNTCIDKLPLFLETECLERLGFDTSEIDYKYVLIGEEESLKNKISSEGEDSPHTWYDLFPKTCGKVYKPVFSWCQIIKILRSKIAFPRLYANILRIDPNEKTVLLDGGATIEYENIVSSIPQDLLLTKLKGVDPMNVSASYARLPYNISLIIGKVNQKISDDEVIVYALGRKRYIASHVVLLKNNINYLKNEYALIYVLTPLKRDTNKTEILIKNFSELDNIGIRVRDVVFARSYIEKYGRLLKPKENLYTKLLEEAGIRLIGRYGSWKELSICDIITATHDY
ncbi:MAG: hypothetical protein QN229_03475 [Desulfurococcaceae archaeon TW002]